ncbi:hypothetical protein FRC03_008467 [Tulasnella sp. 419]|nr:hypothetical protein FRC03_008467 [Tulasnella sp. 419]
MLVRAPPPLPDEEKFVPPVWTAIGPSNRGYGMLEKHGWEEGQALGLGMHRVKSEVVTNESKLTSSAATFGGTHEVEDAEVIDLTAEDSTSEESEEDERESVDAVSIFSAAKAQKPARAHAASSRLEDGSRALLTPLPTTLKPDRTGIGSKGLTKKKITHTAEAIAIHARFARKAQRQAVHNSGAQTSERGAKGFSRKMRREERARVDLLAYMKS